MARILTAAEAARWIAVPHADDDKYSRGVVGFVTGSTQYPGAAVLGVDAALHTGVGMVRYLGPGRPTRLVLQRRPEAVTADGRVQAWVIGSGQTPEREADTEARIASALAQDVPIVLDGGAFDLRERVSGPVVLTPHAGELARILGVERAAIVADPEAHAVRAARELGAVVLLKGATTRVADPDGTVLEARSATPWLATAGAGDALAGVLGALVATHHRELAEDRTALAPISAAAAVLHGLAAQRASRGGPFPIVELAQELPGTIAGLLRHG